MNLWREINPGFVLIVLGVIAFLPPRGRLRAGLITLAPLIALGLLLLARYDSYGRTALLGMELVTYRLDPLSFGFAVAALITQFLWAVHSWNRTREGEDAAGLVQAGAAVSAILAGDLASFSVLFGLWGLAFTVVPLSGRNERGLNAALRGLLLLSAAWVVLLAGVSLHAADAGTGLAFVRLSPDNPAGFLILAGILTAAGAPFINLWLIEGVSWSGAHGAAGLAPLAGKLGLYALMRAFPGEDSLLAIGAFGAVWAAIAALSERDARRAVAHLLAGSLALMIMGVGMGAPFGLVGAGVYSTVQGLGILLVMMAMSDAQTLRQPVRRPPDHISAGPSGRMPLTAAAFALGGAVLIGVPGIGGFAGFALLHAGIDGAPVWALAALIIYPVAGLRVMMFRLAPAIGGDADTRLAQFSPTDPRAPAPAAGTGFLQILAFGLAASICLYSGVAPDWLAALTPSPDVLEPYAGGFLWVSLQILGGGAIALAFFGRGLLPESRLAQRLAGVVDYGDGPLKRLFEFGSHQAGLVWRGTKFLRTGAGRGALASHKAEDKTYQPESRPARRSIATRAALLRDAALLGPGAIGAAMVWWVILR